MGARQRKWAFKKRRELIRLLGCRCVDCGVTDIDVLEVDYINGRDYESRKLDSSGRVSRYWVD